MTQWDGASAHGDSDEGKATRGPQAAAPLQVILASLPATTMLPAGWVLERLTSGSSPAGHAKEGTLSAQEFGDLRLPRRTADWVREKCAEGCIDGAYKDGGEWRIPRAALDQPIQPRSRVASVEPMNARTSHRAKSGAPAFPRWRQD